MNEITSYFLFGFVMGFIVGAITFFSWLLLKSDKGRNKE